MPLFDSNDIERLSSSLGMFTPDTSYDMQRHDLTKGSDFLAIDCDSPHERDDAIRVLRMRRQAGFIVQVAVADPTTLSPELIVAAHDSGDNVYKGRQCVSAMFPESVTAMLELSATRHQDKRGRRAVVLESRYDNDAQPLAPIDVYHAWIKVREFHRGAFVNYYLRSQQDGLEHPIPSFDMRYRLAHGVNYQLPEVFGGDLTSSDFGSRIVQTVMIQSNLRATHLALMAGAPVLGKSNKAVSDAWGGSGSEVIPIQRLAPEHAVSGEPYGRFTSPLRLVQPLLNLTALAAPQAEVSAVVAELVSRR